MTGLPPLGTPVALEVERGGVPGVEVVTVAAYVVAGLGAVDTRTAAAWHSADAEGDAPGARVWAALVTRAGHPAGQIRAARVAGAALRADDLERMRAATMRDLEALA